MAKDIIVTAGVPQAATLAVAGYDFVKIYGSTTETGVFSEITGVGTRPALVGTTTSYPKLFLAISELFFATSAYRSSDGEETILSPVMGLDDDTVTVVTDLKCRAAYLHPEGYRGTMRDFARDSVQLTAVGMGSDGNRPYHIERDYSLQLFITYTAGGVVKGVNLTGATIVFTVYDSAGAEIFQKVTGTNITILSQAVEFNEDGSGLRGGMQIEWADDETGVAAYEVGEHDFDCVVTWPGSEETDSLIGKFEIVK